MTDPISLRKIPPEALKLAQELSTQTGLSIIDLLRLALASGLLIEATKVSPRADGTQGGLEGRWLAKALRRHLGAAIDLLLEYGEHPYQAMMHARPEEPPHVRGRHTLPPGGTSANRTDGEPSLADDVDALGFGLGLSESLTQEATP
jgi:hypothetical protein